MSETKPASSAAHPRPRRRVTFLMVLSALMTTLLLLIVGDAVVGGLLFALLESLHVAYNTILWTEGGLVVLSLVPAVWLFRQAVLAERDDLAPNGS